MGPAVKKAGGGNTSSDVLGAIAAVRPAHVTRARARRAWWKIPVRAIPAAIVGAAVALATPAWAMPLREPLPARAVERHLALPAGWTEGGLTWRGGFTQRGTVHRADVEARVGVPWFELLARIPLRVRPDGDAVPGPLTVVVTFQPWRDEPPAASVVVRAGASGPLGTDAARVWGGMAGRRQFGPVALEIDARLGAGRGAAGVWGPWSWCAAAMDLQAGPVVFTARGSAHHLPFGGWRPEVGGAVRVQVSRGVDLVGEGGVRWPPLAGLRAVPWAGVSLRVRGAPRQDDGSPWPSDDR